MVIITSDIRENMLVVWQTNGGHVCPREELQASSNRLYVCLHDD